MNKLPVLFVPLLWALGVSAEAPAPMEPTMKLTFDAAALVKEFPVQVRHANKQVVLDLAAPQKSVGKVSVSRWGAPAVPATFPAAGPKVAAVAGFFTYDVPPEKTVAWQLNFADPDVFAFYAGGLLAQDELQVAEHPILAAVRSALVAKKLPTATVEAGKPTPILVMGAQRRVAINTAPTKANRAGLYGNRFAAAPADVVRQAVTVLDPPTTSNILALAAPRPGSGDYTAETLAYILATAYTGFSAAKQLSGESACEIHTGFWGCGAFGGNRTVMVAVQLAAAQLAGVDTLVFHTGDAGGEKDFAAGQAAFEKLSAQADTATFLKKLQAAKYQWGSSDGN